MALIPFLISVLIVVVIIYCVRLLLPLLGLPEPVNHVVLIIVGLCALLWLLGNLGFVGSGPVILHRG